MRILAIRGENLASLAAPFEIDLAAEPLLGSGLFAITGETGAGKSTILASPLVGGKIRPIPAGRRFQFMMAERSCAEALAADMPR